MYPIENQKDTPTNTQIINTQIAQEKFISQNRNFPKCGIFFPKHSFFIPYIFVNFYCTH